MKYVNIKLIMDRLTRHPLLEDINLETVIDYTVEFMRIVGTPPSFLEKTEVIPIHKYRGELPCDFYEMIQVRIANYSECFKGKPAFRYSTDSFHMSEKKPKHSDLTYKIQDNVIFTSPLEEGNIEIAYRAIPVDNDGYPLVPDNSTYTRALEAFIKREWFTIQFDLGKISPQAMQKADQDYSWAVGQAQTDLIRPSIDQLEAISNMWNTLVPRATEHRRGFLHSGTQEHIKIQ